MARLSALILATVLGTGYGATWIWGRAASERALRRELTESVATFWREHGIRRPLPSLVIEDMRSIPILPGVLLVDYYPTADGRGACFDDRRLVFLDGYHAVPVDPHEIVDRIVERIDRLERSIADVE